MKKKGKVIELFSHFAPERRERGRRKKREVFSDWPMGKGGDEEGEIFIFIEAKKEKDRQRSEGHDLIEFCLRQLRLPACTYFPFHPLAAHCRCNMRRCAEEKINHY